MSLLPRIEQLARSPVLLVASDYDGTLAPIVNDPAAASPHPAALLALQALSELPHTHVAIISGRALADLSTHVAALQRGHLVGSHGAEFSSGLASPLTPELLQRHTQLVSIVRAIAAQTPGTTIEIKPAGVAFHYRNADPHHAAPALRDLLNAAAEYPEVSLQHGKMVLELSLVHTHKGAALTSLRQQLHATAVCFIGDDVTDEDAFRTLAPPDLSVKVGDGPTAAQCRVPDTLAVAEFLATCLARRAAGR